ncbi:MAG: helix-turn-helix domain-containing protein [Sphingomonadales bacterium]
MSPADLPSLRDEVPDGPTTVSNAPAVAVRVLERALGKQIRQVRRELDLSVADLANAAGISIGMMSKIENGQISPSLSTLQAISSALSVPLSSLFASFEERQDCSYVPAGQGVTIERRGSKVGHVYQLLGHALRGDIILEPYLITLEEDAAAFTGFHHAGVEFIYMLEGEVVYRHGGAAYHLRPGDSLLFDSTALHGPESLVTRSSRYLSIIVYPGRG